MFAASSNVSRHWICSRVAWHRGDRSRVSLRASGPALDTDAYPVLVGKKNLEVRPLAVNKGEIVRRLIYENPDADYIFCAGDDKVAPIYFRARTIR
jgi:trehalose-6-phosphatase